MDQEKLNELMKTLEVLMQGHQMDMIEAQAQKILAVAPEHEYAHFCLMYSLINRRLYDQLLDEGKRCLQLFPNQAWVHDLMYYYYLHKGGNDYLLAKKHIEKAIELDPMQAGYYRNLGEIYLINREPEKALKHLKMAVKLKPANAEYVSRLGLALIRNGLVTEALQAVDKALADDPDHRDVLDSSGMVYLLSGELAAGEKLFRDALKRYPTYEYFQSHLAWVEREKKDREIRLGQGKKYTPLYLRQTDRKRFFDEDAVN